MTKLYNHYLGKAGHLVAMSEFLVRGWNVAIPEVDVGDDIFVVHDREGILKRVQVKTSTASKRKKHYSAMFQVNKLQLADIRGSLVTYVFLARTEIGWLKPVIMAQNVLLGYIENQQMGTAHQDNVVLLQMSMQSVRV